MNTDVVQWDDNLSDLNLGCQNIFDEISLDFLDVAVETLDIDTNYQPKSRKAINVSC